MTASVGRLSQDKLSESVPLQPIAERKVHTYDEALVEAGFGRAQIVLTLVAGLAVMASANESMGMGMILPASQCDLDLDLSRKGAIGGAVLLGIMVSTYYWGYQTDVRGRQSVLKVTLLTTFALSVAASCANNFYVLLVLRFLAGLFISAPSSAAIVYLGEFCPANRRGQMVTYSCVIGAAGLAYVALVAWWILSYDWLIVVTESFTIRPWRLLFLINGLPGLVVGIVICFFPETPKFLLAQGRNWEALEVLRWMHRWNKGHDEFYDVYALQVECQTIDSNVPQKTKNRRLWNQLAPLLKSPYWIYLVACSIQTASVYVTYGGLSMWFPQIMHLVYSSNSPSNSQFCSIIQSSNTSQTIEVASPSQHACSDTLPPETFIYTLTLGTLCSAFILLNSLLLSKFTEKPLIYANLTAAGLVGAALQHVSHTYTVAALFCLQIAVGGVTIVLIRSLQVSIFGTEVKATAVALTTLAGRLGQVVSNVLFGTLLVRQCSGTLYLVAALLLLSVALNVLLP
ncbi:synaptic vesicle glycoprotein 2A-like [Culex pipiens pallens]|uniref:synaptic vesicle glycoprotein 2A-like n=1 Tax=Culex pipiens pallens TaxID=42434 RepID=UPI00195454D2|nr:synaptic vesicle glycoprotein 2A-like [Culex pipiens pallens]